MCVCVGVVRAYHHSLYQHCRGLQGLLNQRRKLLSYLRRDNFPRYAFVIHKLGLKDTYAKQVRSIAWVWCGVGAEEEVGPQRKATGEGRGADRGAVQTGLKCRVGEICGQASERATTATAGTLRACEGSPPYCASHTQRTLPPSRSAMTSTGWARAWAHQQSL